MHLFKPAFQKNTENFFAEIILKLKDQTLETSLIFGNRGMAKIM